MKHERLHALADGIFAIAMTLLVLELRVPELPHATNSELLNSLKDLLPSIYSFILSFLLLFIFWRAFNAIIGTLAKTLDSTVGLLSMIYLLLVCFVPFSSYFFGKYGSTQVGVIVYATNLILIGLAFNILRKYILKSSNVETTDNWKRRDHRNATIRTIIPVFVSIIAIVVSYFSPRVAGILLLGIVFVNIFNRGFDWLFKVLDALKIGVDDD